jgi:hypothetical protein
VLPLGERVYRNDPRYLLRLRTAGGTGGINTLAVRSRQVLAAGSDMNAAGNFDVLIRAYKVK